MATKYNLRKEDESATRLMTEEDKILIKRYYRWGRSSENEARLYDRVTGQEILLVNALGSIRNKQLRQALERRKEEAASRSPTWFTVKELLEQERTTCCGAVTGCGGCYGGTCAKTVAIKYVRYLLNSYRAIPSNVFETIIYGSDEELEVL